MSANRKGLVTFSTIDPNAALAAAVAKTRAEIIGEVTASKLKGRGGAGFPTGVKWNLAAAAKGDAKYVICNADEGEPGTFKDRVILAEVPDLVFAGMTIGGIAIGGFAVGYYAVGGAAIGAHTISQAMQDPQALEFFRTWAPGILPARLR